MLRKLEIARRQGLLGDLDVHFARLIAESGESPPVLLAAALLSQLTSSGHVCLDLDALAQQPVLDGNNLVAPPLAEWQAALSEHPACGDAVAYTPLVLEGTRLYMRRYYDYECAIATAWQRDTQTILPPTLQARIDVLFPVPTTGEDKQRDQREAAMHALTHQRVLISGGPGTGKTTTLASILALLLEQAIQTPPLTPTLSPGGRGGQIRSVAKPLAGLRILLAAPTGKAAARMQDAIRGARSRLPIAEEIKAAMPETAQTLHRLLGMRPQGGGAVWRHHADNPLDCDVLVVDEASMIDMALMARLLDALPSHARLVLLGDRDQLASVDAGAVFADLCAAGAKEQSPPASPVCPQAHIAAVGTWGRPGAAMLNVSYRFDSASGIGRLASLLREGRADAAVQLLANPPADVRWLPHAARSAVVAHAAAAYAAFIATLQSPQPIDIFERFAAFRLLTPLRQGPFGVASLNTEVERALQAQGAIPPRSHWYAGKPVMVTANDYALGLFNGDIGVCVMDPVRGELRVAFPGNEGLRLLAPARLPAHETAWAMTVHKSQGSEFDQLALVLPDEPSELVTRELVYTAVTRARQAVSIWATESSFRAACERSIVRHSGLTARLQGD